MSEKYYNNPEEIEKVVDEFEKTSSYVAAEYSQKLLQDQKHFIRTMLSSGDISVEDIKKTLKNNMKNFEDNRVHYVAKRIEGEVVGKKTPKYLVAVNGIKNEVREIIRVSKDQKNIDEIVSQKIRSSAKIYMQACSYMEKYQ